MCGSEAMNEAGVKETVIYKDEVLLEQLIEQKNLVLAHDLAVKSSEITFDEKLAFRLLQLAIELENEQYVNELILRIPNLNTEEGGKLVWQALIIWNAKIATTLVKAGANLSVRLPADEQRHTLLQVMAAFRNNSEEFYDLALLMMDHEADVNAADEVGNTPLHYAVTLQQEYPDKYSFVFPLELVHRGARIDAVNNQGSSVIDLARHNFEFDGQLTPLLIALADVDDDVKCRWILDAIVTITKTKSEQSVDGLRSLLELGFCVLEMNDLFTDLWMPLYFAVSCYKKEQLELLLDYGWDVNIKFDCFDGITTALHVALQNNFRDIAIVLIERGADIRAVDDASKEEPIHSACRSDSIEVIRLLLRLGADVNIVDSLGRTPYSMINPSPWSDHLRLCLIEQFAILVMKGIKIKDEARKSFCRNPRMLNYMAKCLDELKKMKTIKVNYDISLFCLLNEDVKKISCFVRNSNFTENFYKNLKKLKAAFPVYFKHIEYVVKMAETRRDIILSKEEALADTLNLPQLVTSKIAKYAAFDDLIDFEKRYHIYKKIK